MYYYLVAQLPALEFDAPPPLSIADFLGEAGKWLKAKEVAELQQAGLNPAPIEGCKSRGLKAYCQFENDLRQDLGGWRLAHREGREHTPVHFPPSVLKDGHPLAIEIRLLRVRWDLVDSLGRGHDFDLDALVCYVLKLHILHRLARFDAEKGFTIFGKYCEVSI